MHYDFILVAGIVIIALCLPFFLSTLVQKRRSSATLLLILLVWAAFAVALALRPNGGYRLVDVPRAFIKVMGDIVN